MMAALFPRLAHLTHQPSFSQAEFATKKKTTCREKFFPRMEALLPRAQLVAVNKPFYPEGAAKEAHKAIEKAKASVRAFMATPFHSMKNIFRQRKVRYREWPRTGIYSARSSHRLTVGSIQRSRPTVDSFYAFERYAVNIAFARDGSRSDSTQRGVFGQEGGGVAEAASRTFAGAFA